MDIPHFSLCCFKGLNNILRDWRARCTLWKALYCSAQVSDIWNDEHETVFLPATELGRGIIRLDEVCVWYCTGPSEPDPAAPKPALALPSAADVDPSSSATGEHASARAAVCTSACWPQLLILPSLLHSRLEPLRSSFSDELVMVAGRREMQRFKRHLHWIWMAQIQFDSIKWSFRL